MSIPYKKFSYKYPPRPEYKISSDQLYKYEKDHLIQPKLNGSCCLIFIKGEKIRIFGRHKNENLSNFKLNNKDLKILNCNNDNWNVVVGEYMNKNKNGVYGKPWNHKFVIFDILVHDGEYLIGTTYQERVILLDNIFGVIDENDYLYKITDNIFRVKTFYVDFLERWNNIIKIDMLEGFVLKKKKQKLTIGISEKNNLSHKCRKETKNYRF
jgi:ATP-dependent DNA ligase